MADQTILSGTMDPLAASVSEAARISGVGRTQLYEEMADGELPSCKVGKRRIILIEDLRDWLARKRQSAVRPRPTTPATEPTCRHRKKLAALRAEVGR